MLQEHLALLPKRSGQTARKVAALGVLWKTPRLEGERLRWLFPISVTALRVLLGALGLALFAVVFAAALVGERSVGTNIAPTFIWVIFWLGLVPLVVVFGNLWSVLSPWRAVADAVAWLWSKTGRGWEPAAQYPERLGLWPAAVLLLAFATLELAYPRSAEPRTLALAIVVYSWITWAGVLIFGRRTWIDNGEAFSADKLRAAVGASKSKPVELLYRQGDTFKTIKLADFRKEPAEIAALLRAAVASRWRRPPRCCPGPSGSC